MSYWRNGDEWDYYSESRPRKVEDGIKTRSERGAIGETWWSKRWVRALESLGMGSRLTRGRSYARQGQVLAIDIQPGSVKAKVQGSRIQPYKITIGLQPLSDQDWDRVTAAMAAQAIFAAKLLAGEMPRTIEEAFEAAGLALFPTTQRDLVTDCSCPDWANPCKHIAAVYYILAERFDEDPFLLFKLRGRTREELIGALRQKRSEAFPVESAASPTAETSVAVADDPPLPREEALATFWQAGEGLATFAVNPHTPDVDKAILKRLGDGPYQLNGRNITSYLSTAYDAVSTAAQRKIEELQG